MTLLEAPLRINTVSLDYDRISKPPLLVQKR